MCADKEICCMSGIASQIKGKSMVWSGTQHKNTNAPCYQPLEREIHRLLLNSYYKGHLCGKCYCVCGAVHLEMTHFHLDKGTVFVLQDIIIFKSKTWTLTHCQHSLLDCESDVLRYVFRSVYHNMHHKGVQFNTNNSVQCAMFSDDRMTEYIMGVINPRLNLEIERSLWDYWQNDNMFTLL